MRKIGGGGWAAGGGSDWQHGGKEDEQGRTARMRGTVRTHAVAPSAPLSATEFVRGDIRVPLSGSVQKTIRPAPGKEARVPGRTSSLSSPSSGRICRTGPRSVSEQRWHGAVITTLSLGRASLRGRRTSAGRRRRPHLVLDGRTWGWGWMVVVCTGEKGV